jgi:hypothetical protein
MIEKKNILLFSIYIFLVLLIFLVPAPVEFNPDDLDNILPVINYDFFNESIVISDFGEFGTLAMYNLTRNSDVCLTNCFAEGTAQLFESGYLFNNVTFLGNTTGVNYSLSIYENVSVPHVVNEYGEICDFATLPNGTSLNCDPFLLSSDTIYGYESRLVSYDNEILPVGLYDWRLDIDKPINTNVDWGVFAYGVDFHPFWAWLNTSFAYRMPVNFTELYGVKSRTYEPVFINVSGLTLNSNNCSKEIRFSDDSDVELPSQIVNSEGQALGDGVEWCEALVVVNATQSANTTYYVYYGNLSEVDVPDYSSEVALNLSTGVDTWTVYTGTISANGTDSFSSASSLIGSSIDSVDSTAYRADNPADFAFTSTGAKCLSGTINVIEDGAIRKIIGCQSEVISTWYINMTFYNNVPYISVDVNIDPDDIFYFSYNPSSDITHYGFNNSASTAIASGTSDPVSTDGVWGFWKSGGSEVWFLGYDTSQDVEYGNKALVSGSVLYFCYSTPNGEEVCTSDSFSYYYGATLDVSPSFDTANASVMSILDYPLTFSLGAEEDLDLVNPTIVVNSPLGTVTSNNVTLNFTMADNLGLVTCEYNVTTSGDGPIVSNRAIDCGSSIDYQTISDGILYKLWTYADDEFGNINVTLTNFTVDTSSPPSPPASGGGGGSTELPEDFLTIWAWLQAIYYGQTGDLSGTFESYNPQIYDDVSPAWNDFFLGSSDLGSLSNNLFNAVTTTLRYIFRQPASLGGGI